MFRFVVLLFIFGAVTADLARPTEDQLRWNGYELGAIIHFNIATFVPSSDGCNENTPSVPNMALFKPDKLDIQQWADTLKAYGARYAVMVVKHACGFALWPTNVSFDSFNFTYKYNIANSPFNGTADIAHDFVNIMRQNGIAPGFYYTTWTNLYLNVFNGKVQNGTLKPGQVRVTQEQYYQIAVAQLTELWSKYGDLAEIWFDGGYPVDVQEQVSNLLHQYQPHAVVFGGLNLTPNRIRWVGTESGEPSAPMWSAINSESSVDPHGNRWYPPECDTTLQNNDRWFYLSSVGLRSLETMKEVYHSSVGDNCNLLLDLTPDQTGVVPSSYAAAYKGFGDFIRECYAAEATIETYGSGYNIEVTVNPFVRIDRFVIQEAIEEGQRVLAYTVWVELPIQGWVQVTTAQSIGYKRIFILDAAVAATGIRLSITDALDLPIIQYFAGYDCSNL